MVSDLVEVSMTPKTNIMHFWRHQDIPKCKKIRNTPQQDCSRDYADFVNRFCRIQKRQAPKIMKIRLIFFEHLEYEINILQK